MNAKVRFNDEIGYLEIWDQIRKQITGDECEKEEFTNMLDVLTHHAELAMEKCKPKHYEIYSALWCVLHEEVVNKTKHFTESSKHIDEKRMLVDSGFETFHSELPMQYGSKLLTSCDTDINQKMRSHRSRRIKSRPQKLLLQNVTPDHFVKNAFDRELSVLNESTNTYRYVVTAVMCFVCLIVLLPHRFIPWFFTLVSYNSPPPL